MNQSSEATEAGRYLAALFENAPDGSLIEVRCPKMPWLRRFFSATAIDAVATYIARHSGTTDVYIGVAPRIRIEPQTGGKDAIDHVQAQCADCDTPDSIAMLAAFVPKPTIEVSSGGGVHAY